MFPLEIRCGKGACRGVCHRVAAGFFERLDHVLGIDRLSQVMGRTEFDGFDGSGNTGVAR